MARQSKAGEPVRILSTMGDSLPNLIPAGQEPMSGGYRMASTTRLPTGGAYTEPYDAEAIIPAAAPAPQTPIGVSPTTAPPNFYEQAVGQLDPRMQQIIRQGPSYEQPVDTYLPPPTLAPDPSRPDVGGQQALLLKLLPLMIAAGGIKTGATAYASGMQGLDQYADERYSREALETANRNKQQLEIWKMQQQGLTSRNEDITRRNTNQTNLYNAASDRVTGAERGLQTAWQFGESMEEKQKKSRISTITQAIASLYKSVDPEWSTPEMVQQANAQINELYAQLGQIDPAAPAIAASNMQYYGVPPAKIAANNAAITVAQGRNDQSNLNNWRDNETRKGIAQADRTLRERINNADLAVQRQGIAINYMLRVMENEQEYAKLQQQLSTRGNDNQKELLQGYLTQMKAADDNLRGVLDNIQTANTDPTRFRKGEALYTAAREDMEAMSAQADEWAKARRDNAIQANRILQQMGVQTPYEGIEINGVMESQGGLAPYDPSAAARRIQKGQIPAAPPRPQRKAGAPVNVPVNAGRPAGSNVPNTNQPARGGFKKAKTKSGIEFEYRIN